MAKAIDHLARRRRIVAESLKLFATHGFSQVNFGMIAKSSGVARTILYTYFKDKRAIFNEAIEEVTGKIRATYDVAASTAATADAKLRQICLTVFAVLFDNRDFVCVIADVLANYRRKGSVPVERVRAHTEGLVRVFRRFLSEGIAKGELRSELDPDCLAEVLYSQFEATALRMAVTGNASLASCIDGMDTLLLALRPSSH